MRVKIILILIAFFSFNGYAQQEKIEWISFEEAVERNKTNPKKILVDVYTEWCGWCKKMDANTFTNPVIIKYIQNNYWAVKLNAERKDSILLGDQLFVNENISGRRGAHQLAIALLNGKMTYPSMVYLDEKVELMHPAIAGYQDPNNLEKIIKYFGENAHESIPWNKYQTDFKSEIGQNIKNQKN